MKDQYFGDINDYRKYGLLRAILAAANVRLGVCWMPTAPDSRTDGRAWFANCRRQLDGCDLVFFDPDNGLERSVAFGRRHSHKFLYSTEIRDTFSAGASVLVYQHFPREDRAAYTERLADRLRAETSASAIFSFSTPYVLFLLAAARVFGSAEGPICTQSPVPLQKCLKLRQSER